MPSQTDRFNGFIDDYGLEIETVEDSFEKSIARYEFPFKDGALLEDMGQKARTIKIRCYFYEDTYESHKEFLNHLEKKELFELLHPKYGIIKGCIETVSVRHDDRTAAAEIDITFVENKRSAIETGEQGAYSWGAVDNQVEASFVEGQEELIKEFELDMTEELGAEADEILAKELNPAQGILEQFSSVSLKAREFAAQVDTYVRTLESTLNNITQPANSLISTINYASNLPGRVIGAVTRTVERYALLYNTFKNAPDRFLKSLKDALKKLEKSFDGFKTKKTKKKVFSKYIKLASSQRFALEAAYIYKEDETKRQAAKRLEKTKSFDALGNYIKPESAERLMTVNELESTLAETREYLQDALDESRGMQSLKDTALELLNHVEQIKIERGKLIKAELDNPMPLHLVCMKYGLPYNYAERIYSVNKIKHPNFTNGGINIYVR